MAAESQVQTNDMFGNADYLAYLKTEIGQSAWRFDQENPHVYDLFKRFSEQVRRKGYKRFSANAIFERIRWETMIQTVDSLKIRDKEIKLSNNYRAFYARKLMAEDLRFVGFFEIREVRENA